MVVVTDRRARSARSRSSGEQKRATHLEWIIWRIINVEKREKSPRGSSLCTKHTKYLTKANSITRERLYITNE